MTKNYFNVVSFQSFQTLQLHTIYIFPNTTMNIFSIPRKSKTQQILNPLLKSLKFWNIPLIISLWDIFIFLFHENDKTWVPYVYSFEEGSKLFSPFVPKLFDFYNCCTTFRNIPHLFPRNWKFWRVESKKKKSCATIYFRCWESCFHPLLLLC